MQDSKPEINWNELDIYKMEFEYLKYLTTISTGSILLIVAFLEKLFAQPEWKPAIALALCSFVLSIALCAFSQATIIDKVSEKKSIDVRSSVQKWTIGLLLLALFSYVIGIVSLVAFGLKNLF